jgi:beta-lactam-binding protein with PASTA domain
VRVPDVVGQQRAEARSLLIAAGFLVLEVFEPRPAGAAPAPAAGTVWRQTPISGSARPADGVVQISIQP